MRRLGNKEVSGRNLVDREFVFLLLRALVRRHESQFRSIVTHLIHTLIEIWNDGTGEVLSFYHTIAMPVFRKLVIDLKFYRARIFFSRY